MGEDRVGAECADLPSEAVAIGPQPAHLALKGRLATMSLGHGTRRENAAPVHHAAVDVCLEPSGHVRGR